ncbi:MAG: hypothetical protein PHF44_03360 [Candidatus Pacebacteria bacterium]|nr:hypothetical protein [Candidatus Paceibacterota bacterium]
MDSKEIANAIYRAKRRVKKWRKEGLIVDLTIPEGFAVACASYVKIVRPGLEAADREAINSRVRAGFLSAGY